MRRSAVIEVFRNTNVRVADMQLARMKAIVKYREGKGFVELRDVPMPTPGPNEVRIKVECAGICASDMHILNYDIAITIKPPVVMGHEFSGTIDQIGADVEGWGVGDRVVAEANYEVYSASGYGSSLPRLLGVSQGSSG